MKPFKFVFSILVLLFSLVGCSKSPESIHAHSTGEKVICTSFYPIYVATVNVTRDVPGVKVINMTQPFTGCLHDYQLTTQDLKTLSTADYFVVNGLGMEQFMEKVMSQLPKVKIIESSKGIETIKNEHAEEEHQGHNHKDEKDDDHDDEVNPHVWVGIGGAIVQVNNIAQGLAAADPEHADLYLKNGKAYIARLEELRRKMHEGLKDAKSRDLIVFHEAFPYFAKEFGLKIVGVIEREPGSEPSAKEIADSVKLIRATKVKAIFVEPQYPTNSADAIARESGVKILTLDPCVTGSLSLPEAYDSYTKTMEKNLASLVEALH